MSLCTLTISHVVVLWYSGFALLPGSDVTRCHNRLPWSAEQAGQVEAFVTSCLHVIRELHYDNVGHGVAELGMKKEAV